MLDQTVDNHQIMSMLQDTGAISIHEANILSNLLEEEDDRILTIFETYDNDSDVVNIINLLY